MVSISSWVRGQEKGAVTHIEGEPAHGVNRFAGKRGDVVGQDDCIFSQPVGGFDCSAVGQ